MSKRWTKTTGKLTVIMIVLSALFLSLTACTSNEGKTPAQSKPSAAGEQSHFNAEGLPIVDEPITLNVLTVRLGGMGDSFLGNKWLKELEESTNVKINWEVKSSSDWNDQKALMLATGTLPDIIIGDSVFNDSDIVNNLDFFRSLDELVDNYMPNFKAAMEETPIMRQLATFPDGKMYSLPAMLPARPNSNYQPTINKVWLDKLGLGIPDTLDDLYEVLKAFKEGDPNGNGLQDEIPFTASGDIPLDILSVFGITDTYSTGMELVDGQPVFYATMEQYKAAMNWLHKLYAEGLIDRELFTQDGTMLTAKRDNPDGAMVGFAYGWVPDANFKRWTDEYIAIPPIAGPDGKRYQRGDPDGYRFRPHNFLITTFSEHPEAAARWADEWYTNEASIQNFWGEIGKVIEKHDDGTYSLNAPPEGTGADAWYWENALRDFGPKYVDPDFEQKIKLDATAGDGLKLAIDQLGRDYIPPQFPLVNYLPEEHQEMANLLTDINAFVKSTRAKWITQGGVDQEWDAYVNQLHAMGLDGLVKIRTGDYERYMSTQ